MMSSRRVYVHLTEFEYRALQHVSMGAGMCMGQYLQAFTKRMLLSREQEDTNFAHWADNERRLLHWEEMHRPSRG